MTDYKRGEERIWRVCDVDGPRMSCREAGEIVRCRDCVNCAMASDGSGTYCAHWGHRVPLGGFCHLGERRNDERGD